MKLFILLSLFVSTTAMATIPTGKYLLDKIQCKTGKTLKLGGKFMTYKITLDVTESDMVMTAKAKSGSWAPFKLSCTQINKGTFVYTKENTYEGDLPKDSIRCNAKAWVKILQKKQFGVEKYGEFTYSVNGNKLTSFNPKTITKYSCKGANNYPIYHYTKVN